MKNYLVSFILISFVFLISCASSQNKDLPPLTTVEQVDINRYVGLWYEIAKIPNSFQDHCAYGTTAEYKIDNDGDIIVINSCYDEDGKIDIADGVANVVDKKTNSKLEVSFVSFLGIRPFWGDYWIIGLDEDYQWVVIGTPNRKYGWILSRTSFLPDQTIQKIYSILEEQHYKPDDFQMSPQQK